MQKSLTDKNLESLFKFGCQTLENTKDYDRAIKITDVNELGDVMISQLSALFDKKTQLH